MRFCKHGFAIRECRTEIFAGKINRCHCCKSLYGTLNIDEKYCSGCTPSPYIRENKKEKRGAKPTEIKHRVEAATPEILQLIQSNPWMTFTDIAKIFNLNTAWISVVARKHGFKKVYVPEAKKYITTRIGE